MAETLGSLIDKLAINDVRQYHLKEMLKYYSERALSGRQRKALIFSKANLKKKLKLAQLQKKDLLQEIDDFLKAAVRGRVRIRFQKLKLYNAPGKEKEGIANSNSIGQTISSLAQKNLELWHLEDEARRRDVGIAYIGRIKRKIDLANQQRNDLIDTLDELLEKCLRKSVSSS
jgi:hypothetical protein